MEDQFANNILDCYNPNKIPNLLFPPRLRRSRAQIQYIKIGDVYVRLWRATIGGDLRYFYDEVEEILREEGEYKFPKMKQVFVEDDDVMHYDPYYEEY